MKELDEFEFEELNEEENSQIVNDEISDFEFEPLTEQENQEITKVQEVKQKKSEERVDSENSLNKILGTTAGAGLGKILQKTGETLGDSQGLRDSAEKMAFAAIGGDTTASGRKFLKDELEKLGDSALNSRVNVNTVGRTALDDSLIGKYLGLTNSGKAYEKAENVMLANINNKNNLISKINKDIPLEQIQNDLKTPLLEKFNPLVDSDQQAAKILEEKAGDFTGYQSLSDLEKAKSRMTDANIFQQDAEGKNLYKQAKRASINKNVEAAVLEEGGDDLLDKFRQYKAKTGNAGVARNMLIQDSIKSKALPDVNLTDIGVAGVASPEAAIARRALKDQGKGIIARQLDNLSKVSETVGDTLGKVPGLKTAGKGLLKSLPFIGGVVGAIESGNASDAIPFLGDSEDVGPQKGSLEHRLETGDLTPVESEEYHRQQTLLRFDQLQKDKIKDFSKKTMKLKPEEYSDLYSRAVEMDDPQLNKFLPLMEKGLIDDESRTRSMFGLSQHPYFRKKMGDLLE